jgi:hypothetical protein
MMPSPVGAGGPDAALHVAYSPSAKRRIQFAENMDGSVFCLAQSIDTLLVRKRPPVENISSYYAFLSMGLFDVHARRAEVSR